MAQKAGTYPLESFGGLVTSSAIIKMDNKYSPRCMNIYSRVLGSLRKCLGYAKLNSGTTSAGCNGILGFLKDSTDKYLMGLWGTGLYKMDSSATGWDGTWDSVTLDTASALSDSRASMEVFKKGGNGIFIIGTESRDLPHTWDGSGATEVIPGAAKGKFYKVWQSHVWAANCETFTVIDDCDDPWDVDEKQVENCNDVWDEQVVANVTVATDATDHKEGTACVKISVAAGFTTGIAATEVIGSLDLSTYSYMNLWIKSSINVNAGDLQFIMDETAECASPDETVNMPGLTAGEWTHVQLTFASATTTRDAVISLGLNVAVDNGAQVVYIDDIRASNRQNVSTSTDQEDTKDGDASIIASIAAGHTTGLVCAKELSNELDLTHDTKLAVWAKSTYDSSGDTDSGLQILLDTTDDCSSATTQEALTIPKMAADTWTYHEITLANPTTDTAINSVGLKVATDKGVQSVRIAMVRTTYPEPDQLRRSAIGEYLDWDGTDSGWDNIFTTNDVGLSGMEELAGRLYVYKAHSIHRITYLTGRPLLDIKEADGTIGTRSPHSIVNVTIPKKGPRQIFLGSDKMLYLFDGYTPTPIGEDIFVSNGFSDVYLENINSATGVVNALELCHAIHIPERNWYVLFCPQGDSATACTHAIIYDYLSDTFYPMDTQTFTSSWHGDDGNSSGGSDTSFVAKTNYAYSWWSGNDFDGTDITSYWDSAKISASKKGRPLEKGAIEAAISYATVASATFQFKYRVDWQSAYTTSPDTITTTAAGTDTKKMGVSGNLIQIELYDSSSNPAWEIYAVDLLGIERMIGRNLD